MKSYEVCNVFGNTDLSIYIGRKGLVEEKLTSLVIQVNPGKGGGKNTEERMNTFGVLRNISHCDYGSLETKQQVVQLSLPLRAMSLFLDKECGQWLSCSSSMPWFMFYTQRVLCGFFFLFFM